MEYRIIGSDLREYGPVDLEEIREWIQEGRADGNTLVCEMDDKQWVRLRDMPLVADDLKKIPPTIAGSARPSSDGTIQINYLVPAILCTVFCCLPFGIAGILFAADANSKAKQGDYDAAGVAASRAKLMCILSFVFWLITIGIWVSSGEFQRIIDSVPR